MPLKRKRTSNKVWGNGSWYIMRHPDHLRLYRVSPKSGLYKLVGVGSDLEFLKPEKKS